MDRGDWNWFEWLEISWLSALRVNRPTISATCAKINSTLNIIPLQYYGKISPIRNWSSDVAFPTNTRRWTDADFMLVHRLRRWTNIKSALVQRVVFAWFCTLKQYSDHYTTYTVSVQVNRPNASWMVQRNSTQFRHTQPTSHRGVNLSSRNSWVMMTVRRTNVKPVS